MIRSQLSLTLYCSINNGGSVWILSSIRRSVVLEWLMDPLMAKVLICGCGLTDQRNGGVVSSCRDFLPLKGRLTPAVRSCKRVLWLLKLVSLGQWSSTKLTVASPQSTTHVLLIGGAWRQWNRMLVSFFPVSLFVDVLLVEIRLRLPQRVTIEVILGGSQICRRWLLRLGVFFEIVIEYNIVVVLGQVVGQTEVLFQKAYQLGGRSIVG